MQSSAGIGARIIGNGAGCLIVAVRCFTVPLACFKLKSNLENSLPLPSRNLVLNLPFQLNPLGGAAKSGKIFVGDLLVAVCTLAHLL
jgi:hypothetical protein